MTSLLIYHQIRVDINLAESLLNFGFFQKFGRSFAGE